MISEEITNCEVIDTLIKQNRNFAIYRIPGEDTPRFVMQSSGSARLLYNIANLNGESGFVIAPFHINSRYPIVLIKPDCFKIPEMQSISSSDKLLFHIDISNRSERNVKSDYVHCFELFIKPLKEKKLDKLVLSRSLAINREVNFSPAKTFYKACRRYTRSYVYLCHTPESGTWLGSTPEIILAGKKGEWHTVALAGTQPLLQGELPAYWNDKNREEQRIVATYIRKQLFRLGIRSVEEGPYSARAGELAHLKSDFRFSLPDNNKLGDLLNRLHPTPAVCGLPKEESYRFILENEGYDRRYYSGFIGYLNPEFHSDLYVNLRCMNVQTDTLILYAGGGLLASSVLEEEWTETEDKLQTMRAVLRKR